MNILVTGASKGIGNAIAQELHKMLEKFSLQVEMNRLWLRVMQKAFVYAIYQKM